MAPDPTLATRFLALHRSGTPLLMPNPWDIGSARLLSSLGYQALATTSSGHAATLGRLDGTVSRDEAVEHGGSIASAVAVPVSADLENGFADGPAGVAETVKLAVGAGLAGCSVEDYSGTAIYERAQAVERVRAAVEAAGDALVITARAENLIRGVDDLADTIARLQAFQDVGAPVLFAPGLVRIEDIRSVVTSVDRPVNVLARPNGPTVAELAEAGVARISVGGTFAYVALGAIVEAGRELLDQGTYGFGGRAAVGSAASRAAFS